MNTPPPALDPSFLAIQRARLLALRTGMSRTRRDDVEEARLVQSMGQGQAVEAEDRAQDLTIAESDRILANQLGQQQVAVDRALAKLDEGTYGFSDVSGLPIPIARLQALPQALLTVSEEPGPWTGVGA